MTIKVKASYKATNPFNPDIDKLSYSITVDVPNDISKKELRRLAIAATKKGYVFVKLEQLND